MYVSLTIPERLKDLRIEHGLDIAAVAKATGISSSALSNYENDESKDISHRAVIALAKFYGVSADYLLGLTETKNHPNTDLDDLHLSDDMIGLLKSGRINNRLLCELAGYEDFQRLMVDMEVYVDRMLRQPVDAPYVVAGFFAQYLFAKAVKLVPDGFLLGWCKLQEFSPPSRTAGGGVLTPFATIPFGKDCFGKLRKNFLCGGK